MIIYSSRKWHCRRVSFCRYKRGNIGRHQRVVGGSRGPKPPPQKNPCIQRRSITKKKGTLKKRGRGEEMLSHFRLLSLQTPLSLSSPLLLLRPISLSLSLSSAASKSRRLRPRLIARWLSAARGARPGSGVSMEPHSPDDAAAAADAGAVESVTRDLRDQSLEDKGRKKGLKLEDLSWDHSFVRELPGDPRTDTFPREVWVFASCFRCLILVAHLGVRCFTDRPIVTKGILNWASMRTVRRSELRSSLWLVIFSTSECLFE